MDDSILARKIFQGFIFMMGGNGGEAEKNDC